MLRSDQQQRPVTSGTIAFLCLSGLDCPRCGRSHGQTQPQDFGEKVLSDGSDNEMP